MNQYKLQIEQTLRLLEEKIWISNKVINEIGYAPCGYKLDNEPPELAEFIPLERNTDIGGKDKHCWLHFEHTASMAEDGQLPWLMFNTCNDATWDALNPQILLYLNGKIVQGLDLNHTGCPIVPGKHYDVFLYYYSGMYNHAQRDFSVEEKLLDQRTEKLYYDIKAPFDALQCFEEHNEPYSLIIRHLAAAVNLLDLRQPGNASYYESIQLAGEYLKSQFYRKICGKGEAVVSCIGHTHIDVAWLWTFAQTREKAQRSFATVLSLMKQYPEYRFMSSQPQLYEYVKEAAPDLYNEIKQRVAEGRFEPEGAMWLEADCNLTSGESLIRQIMFGKRFMLNEFGIDSKILWLPDVFGYSAALPQILLKCGVDSFVTSKISWNQYNKLPYDTFVWKGLDGSEIFTYFITAQNYKKGEEPENGTTYVGTITPEMVLGTWERYQQKEYNNNTLITYGFGDGGGGPTRGMLEMQRRLAYGLPGIPKTKISGAKEFIDDVKQKFFESCALLRETPKWCGELYLEMHRGTYTTAVQNKKNNRRAEIMYQNAESACVFNRILNGGEYPQELLNHGWKGILLNQFHDVIPGSSIIEVYQDSEKMYREIINSGKSILQEQLNKLRLSVQTGKRWLVFNPNGFEADGIIKAGEKKAFVRGVPAFGWKGFNNDEASVKTAYTTANAAENQFYRMKIDEFGNISSLFDKRYMREIIKPGDTGNRFELFEDRPYCYDAWEINEYYKHKSYNTNKAESIEAFSDEVSAGFILKKKFGNSSLKQTIRLYDALERIDFETEVDWHETHMLLKQFFPINVNTDKAVFDVQFGNIERKTNLNTSWDRAKFEVCAHKWVDVADGGYGVSLLNDCKYGYSVEESTIGVTVIKAPTYPAPGIDSGISSYTVSLFPHKGDFRAGGTVHQAYLLNNPLCVVEGETEGKYPEQYSMLSCNRENIIIETVKKCETDDSIIIRMYECHNEPCDFVLHTGFKIKEAFLCDMLENQQKNLAIYQDGIKLHCNGYEILTVKLLCETL